MHIIDLHQDLLTHINDRAYFGDHWQTDFDMIPRANVRVLVATAFPVPPHEDWFHPSANDLIEKDFATYRDRASRDERYLLISGFEDVQRAFDEQRTGIIMHIEGLNVFNGTTTDWQRLERWYDMGWRSVGIVWNVSNALGGGTNDPSRGLTLLGAQLLTWAQEKHMIVDCAHMNRATFSDAIKHIRHPLYISHGNCDACCASPRNYTDDQLRAVAASGGVVGCFFAKSYITGRESARATIADVCDHIDHMYNAMGENHIALGTDFGGIISGFVDELDRLDSLPRLWDALSARGYSDDRIEKIAWKNAYRVLNDILL